MGERRLDFLERALLVGGAAAVGATALGRAGSSRASPTATDREALDLLLLVARTEAAFYAEAVDRAALTGELISFARTVGGQEREHVRALEQARGQTDPPDLEFEFGTATADPGVFPTAAAALEDLAVGAYNGQGTRVSPATLAAAATIVSVEARHAAWIRSIAGRPPAPDATDVALTEDEVLEGLERAGLRR